MRKNGSNGQISKENKWKNQDEIYLFELQKFLDIVENVGDEELRKQIIAQMLECDKRVTKLAESIFQRLEEQQDKKQVYKKQ